MRHPPGSLQHGSSASSSLLLPRAPARLPATFRRAAADGERGFALDKPLDGRAPVPERGSSWRRATRARRAQAASRAEPGAASLRLGSGWLLFPAHLALGVPGHGGLLTAALPVAAGSAAAGGHGRLEQQRLAVRGRRTRTGIVVAGLAAVAGGTTPPPRPTPPAGHSAPRRRPPAPVTGRRSSGRGVAEPLAFMAMAGRGSERPRTSAKKAPARENDFRVRARPSSAAGRTGRTATPPDKPSPRRPPRRPSHRRQRTRAHRSTRARHIPIIPSIGASRPSSASGPSVASPAAESERRAARRRRRHAREREREWQWQWKRQRQRQRGNGNGNGGRDGNGKKSNEPTP